MQTSMNYRWFLDKLFNVVWQLNYNRLFQASWRFAYCWSFVCAYRPTTVSDLCYNLHRKNERSVPSSSLNEKWSRQLIPRTEYNVSCHKGQNFTSRLLGQSKKLFVRYFFFAGHRLKYEDHFTRLQNYDIEVRSFVWFRRFHLSNSIGVFHISN